MDHKLIVTTESVWLAIRASHKNLVVFSSYSNPSGNDGMTYQPQMMTEYGFKDSPIPLLRAHTKWDRGEREWDRVNETHEFWICVPLDEDDRPAVG